jgi:hypothetical protein
VLDALASPPLTLLLAAAFPFALLLLLLSTPLSLPGISSIDAAAAAAEDDENPSFCNDALLVLSDDEGERTDVMVVPWWCNEPTCPLDSDVVVVVVVGVVPVPGPPDEWNSLL